MMPYTQVMGGQMQLPQGLPGGQATYQPPLGVPAINPGLPAGTSNVMPAMPTGQMGADRGMPWQGGDGDWMQERNRGQWQQGQQAPGQPDWRRMMMARQLMGGGQAMPQAGQMPMQPMGQQGAPPMMAGANPAMPWMR